MVEKKNFESYEDYFNNRTVADIMEEWSEHKDEWKQLSVNTQEKKENN